MKAVYFLMMLLLYSCGEKNPVNVAMIGAEYILPSDTSLSSQERTALNTICDAFEVKKNVLGNSFRVFDFNINYNYCSETNKSMKARLKLDPYNGEYRFVGIAENEATQFFTAFNTNTSGILSSFCANKGLEQMANIYNASEIFKEVFSFKKQNCNVRSQFMECFEKVTLLKKNPKLETFTVIKVERLLIDTDINKPEFGVIKKQIRHEECTQEGKIVILESEFQKF